MDSSLSSPSLLLSFYYFLFPPLSCFSLPPPIPYTQSLFHIFPPSHSLTLSPGGIQLSAPHRCRTSSNARKRPHNENKARQRKQAGGGEREAEQRRDSSSVLSQPKIEENCRKPWLKKAWTIQTNCHGVNILWRLETEQWGGVGVGRVQSNTI